MKKSHLTRLVTCCYCGGRSTLGGQTSGPLVCHGCGAAIRQIEVLQPALERRKSRQSERKPAIPHAAERPQDHLDKDRPARRRKGKRRKDKSRRNPIWSWVEEAVDEFDDVLDIFD